MVTRRCHAAATLLTPPLSLAVHSVSRHPFRMANPGHSPNSPSNWGRKGSVDHASDARHDGGDFHRDQGT